MPLFNLELLALGLLMMAAVLRARPQEAAVLTHTHAPEPVEGWNPTVRPVERFESVVLLPDPKRVVRLRVLQLSKFGGAATVLHEWNEPGY